MNFVEKAILLYRASVKRRFHGADVPCGGRESKVLSVFQAKSRHAVAALLAGVMAKALVCEAEYKPLYWAEGGICEEAVAEDAAAIERMVDGVHAKGWRGITYWGADLDRAKIRYHFKSPFLEKQSWAICENESLTPLVKAAHAKNMKVLVNLEAVSPYQWKRSQWTPENIKAVADDLAADKVDAVFEECFEVKPDLFLALGKELNRKGVSYISGTDPMLLREPHFAALWPETTAINIYNYYLKRDQIYSIAALAQHGTLGYGWAKFWGKPTALVSPLDRDWGIAGDSAQAVVSYLCMIRALQFRVDNFMIWGGVNGFDPVATQTWIDEYVDKQEKNRPLMDIVVLLKKEVKRPGKGGDNSRWNRLFNSGDAITSGAFNGGYNVVVSDKVVPAEAYWIYAAGGEGDTLPEDVVELFSSHKPVFIQSGDCIPSGKTVTASWKTVLDKCGIDGAKAFGRDSEAEVDESAANPIPTIQTEEIPYTGYYSNTYLRFTGFDAQYGTDLRAGTLIPKRAICGTIYCAPNRTYDRGPFIVGKNEKYVVTATALSWQAAYPISNLLCGGGILPSSNVWGISGSNVTALLAIEATELAITIPGLANGSKIHAVVWDNKRSKTSEETVTYQAPYKRSLKEYDFILINAVTKP